MERLVMGAMESGVTRLTTEVRLLVKILPGKSSLDVGEDWRSCCFGGARRSTDRRVAHLRSGGYSIARNGWCVFSAARNHQPTHLSLVHLSFTSRLPSFHLSI